MADQVGVDAKTLDDVCCLSTVTVYDLIDAIKKQRSDNEKRNGGGYQISLTIAFLRSFDDAL